MDELKDLDHEALCQVLFNIYTNYPMNYYEFINTKLIPVAFSSMNRKDMINLLTGINITYGSADGHFSEQLTLAL